MLSEILEGKDEERSKESQSSAESAMFSELRPNVEWLSFFALSVPNNSLMTTRNTPLTEVQNIFKKLHFALI